MTSKTQEIEAEFTVVEKEGEKSGLPALIGDFPIGLDKEKLERIQQDLELDKKLKLRGQFKQTKKKFFAENAEAVLAKYEYPEVNTDGLKKLFGIYGTNKKVWANNLRVVFTHAVLGPILSVLLFASGIKLLGFFSDVFSHSGLYGRCLSVIPIIIGAAAIPASIAAFVCFWLSFLIKNVSDFLNNILPDALNDYMVKIDLDVESIEETLVKIPFGAKLKVSEAADTGLFNSFLLIKPSLKSFVRKAKWVWPEWDDPAIVGTISIPGTSESKWYLITCWDIKKDMDRVNSSLNNLIRMKKLKLHS